MAQGSQKIPGSGPSAVPDAAAVPGDFAATALPGPVPRTSDCTDAGFEEPTGTVILDEAKDLLVISNAGVLLPPNEDGWGDAVVAGPSELSSKAASWAQEILGNETESAGAESEGPSAPAKDCFDQGDGDDASRQGVDWIDW